MSHVFFNIFTCHCQSKTSAVLCTDLRMFFAWCRNGHNGHVRLSFCPFFCMSVRWSLCLTVGKSNRQKLPQLYTSNIDVGFRPLSRFVGNFGKYLFREVACSRFDLVIRKLVIHLGFYFILL